MLLYITHIISYILLSRARDLQNPAAWTVPEAPGEAFSYWQRSVQPERPERRDPRSEPEPEQLEQPEGPERPGRVCNEPWNSRSRKPMLHVMLCEIHLWFIYEALWSFMKLYEALCDLEGPQFQHISTIPWVSDLPAVLIMSITYLRYCVTLCKCKTLQHVATYSNIWISWTYPGSHFCIACFISFAKPRDAYSPRSVGSQRSAAPRSCVSCAWWNFDDLWRGLESCRTMCKSLGSTGGSSLGFGGRSFLWLGHFTSGGSPSRESLHTNWARLSS